MAIIGAGGEMGFFTPSDSNCIEDTTAGTFDSSFARCSVVAVGSSCYAETQDYGASAITAEGWMHFDLSMSAGGVAGERTLLSWRDNAGAERVRLTHDPSNGNTKLYYDVGAGIVQAGSTITTVLQGSRQTFDLRAVINGASGSLTLYIAGNARITSATIDFTAITNLNKARFTGWLWAGGVDNGRTNVSQVIIATESTIGMAVMTGYPSGAGANTAWGGTFVDIDETVYDDTDFISSATNGQRESVAVTLVSAITGYNVRAYCVNARAKKGSSGPANLQLSVRVGATDYDSSSKALDLGYGSWGNVWEDNPATAVDWTAAEATAAQAGVEANT